VSSASQNLAAAEGYLHGNLEAALCEPLFRVGTKARNIKLLVAMNRIAVEGSFEFVLKVVDHDLLNVSVDGAILTLKIRFAGEEVSK
jgi:hypothetical protein